MTAAEQITAELVASQQSLYDLIGKIGRADRADDEESEQIEQEDFSEELMKLVLEGTKLKIDRCKFVIDELGRNAEYCRQISAAFAKRAKTYDNEQKRLKKRVADALLHEEFEQFPGHIWNVRIGKTESVVTRDSAPSPDMLFHFSDYIRPKYEWDKKALKKALKDGNEEIKQLASIEVSATPIFWAKGKAE